MIYNTFLWDIYFYLLIFYVISSVTYKCVLMPVPRSEDRNMFSFFMALMLSPAVFAALVIALYWLYPIALLHGYRR